MAYLEFIDSEYTQLRKNLLRVKGNQFQRDFLQAARNSDTFVPWIEGRVRVEDEAKDQPFDLWADPLSEAEYKDPPQLVEKGLFKKWASLTPAQASQETFWGYVTLEHIKQGIIQASYLAANRNALSGGLERIDKALVGNQEKDIDSVVRTIMRCLSGLSGERGSRSVYVDCPFARAWWRGCVAREVCDATRADSDKVTKTLARSQAYWEGLIDLIVSRSSVLGDTNVRTALIWALSELVEDESKEGLFKRETLNKISRQIGIRSAWQELGVFSVNDLKRIMEQDFL